MDRRFVCLTALLCSTCSGRSQITLRYHLDTIDPGQVIRVETVVAVDPASDTRQFYADQPFRSVATGIGYSVGDLDGSGTRKMLITHDATLGYAFAKDFVFTLLPPADESPPPLIVTARAVGNSADTIGTAPPVKVTFSGAIDVGLKDTRCGGQACLTDESCCSNLCTHTDRDVLNCGGCGMSCAPGGDSCSGELCRCVGGSACAAGHTCCGGLGCVDLATDPQNCSACGHACNPGETCSGGVCGCGATGLACTGATPLCCPDGTCSTDGTCACGGISCSAPDTCCGGQECVPTNLDNNNCGTCGNVCTNGLTCSGGKCTCNGLICSGGDACCASGCKSLQDDPANCGSCGHACDPGETCSGGMCQCAGGPACGMAQSCCNSACANTATDTQNCGGCGRPCHMGETCASGSCACNGGAACVGNQSCCGDGCFDLSLDNNHCGDCMTVCQSGFACMTGMCKPTTCIPACTQNNQCVGTACSCNGAAPCSAPASCCGSGCTDTNNDPANCGQCGNQCNAADTCKLGKCLRKNGSPCTLAGQCLSNFCIDGVCCESMCKAACMQCNVVGSLGMCVPAPLGQNDPRGMCAVQPPSTCATNGKCDGAGNCQLYVPSTPCGQPSCDPTSNTFTPAPRCDGAGNCKSQGSVSCQPYICASQTACYTSCADQSQCSQPYCNGNSLVTPVCFMTPAAGGGGGGTAGTGGTGGGGGGPDPGRGVCVGTNASCNAYVCLPPSAGGGAHCASGQCGNLISICQALPICAPGCHCDMTVCLTSSCVCP